MFSMKYTSPKVTPKKGAPASAATLALDTSTPYLVHDGGDGSLARMCSPHHISNSLTRKELARHVKANGSAAESHKTKPRQPSELTKDNALISSNHDSSAASDVMSENDSAVANILEEIDEPRPKFLALLDRANGSDGPGEGSSSCKEIMLPSDKNRTTRDGGVDLNVSKDCTRGQPLDAAVPDDQIIENDIDCDENDVIDDTSNLHQSIESSPTKFPQASPMHESAENFEYRRSVSMEPMFDNASRAEEGNANNAPTLTSLSVDEESVEVAPIAEGQTSSLVSSSAGSLKESNVANTTLSRIGKDVNPSSHDVTESQPASPIMSEINCERFGDELTAATESEIGGDTYFEPALPRLETERKPRSDCSFEDDIVHVTLPPRVNRTTSNGYANDGAAPFLSNCPSIPSEMNPAAAPFSPKQGPPPPAILSPRPPFSHTHSLLDDCSDEEEDTTLFTIVDSPPRHGHSYSCLPRPRSNSEGSSPFSSYFQKNKQKQSKHSRPHSRESAGTTATRVASNNIQQALLQTRHRRWECQMSYAGSHAQSKEVFDISNRVHHIPGYFPDNGDEFAARLSVSVEAIRAAALASGLWRTVRLVRLPKGLFPHMDESIENNEIWDLLKMLNSTFPVLDQIDFGGYFVRAPKGPYDIASGDDHWRNEMLACIMEYLPGIVAIDGFVVEKEVLEGEDRNSEKVPSSPEEDKYQHHDAAQIDRSSNDRQGKACDTEANGDASECGDCGGNCETVSMCGLSDLVDSQAGNSQVNGGHGNPNGIISNDRAASSSRIEEPTLVHEPEQFDVTGSISSDGNTPESNIHLVDRRGSPDGHDEQEKIEQSLSHESVNDGMKKVHTLSSSSSLLSSPRSWGSNGSGTRPPTCPHSASRQRSARLPTKPADGKLKGSSLKRLKRRVLGLIPTVSMMDQDEDDEDDDEDSVDAAETDCPTDLL
eukprot:CAMPEP_0181083006 /NCGR_PEP_ID=MMETSP1071-20121207/3927_1 /TAXON_ID=35127 /ORGANISM="Thalassiosira sp., Strain NH16" /LENGTH=940 /DNA_ID=CAMNT_0023164635 /DNA_START=137 /DNA_END=2959 /DNA_ORIENTATION=-